MFTLELNSLPVCRGVIRWNLFLSSFIPEPPKLNASHSNMVKLQMGKMSKCKVWSIVSLGHSSLSSVLGCQGYRSFSGKLFRSVQISLRNQTQNFKSTLSRNFKHTCTHKHIQVTATARKEWTSLEKIGKKELHNNQSVMFFVFF